MSMFEEYRRQILNFLDAYLCRKKEETPPVTRWQHELFDRLLAFSSGGKTIRGSLVCFSYSMFKEPLSPDAVAVGAAMELFQSALLIHDDIMDQDHLRRGELSFHAQYQRQGRKLSLKQPKRFGESMGICGGDVGFFLAFEILGTLSHVSLPTRLKILQTFSSELTLVGLAQMDDVYFEAFPGEPSRQEIERLYRYKTARYTFSLPLTAGAVLAEAPEPILSDLSEIGENMGILFQITDDEIEIFQPEEQTGKSAGSDISRNKKTLLRHALYQACSADEKKRLNQIFGSKKLKPGELEEIQKTLDEKGILFEMADHKKELIRETEILIRNLKIETRQKENFSDFLNILARRKK